MVTGIFAHIAVQVIMNICVVTNVIPTTGVTLPFVSYGGTSLCFLMIEMAIALSVSRRIHSRIREMDLWGEVVDPMADD
jgi:cell division protein FtsW